MQPAAYLSQLPNTGISLSRWRRVDTGMTRLIENPNSSYTLSLILQPMRARAWLGATQIWCGPIGANTIRLTPPGVDPRWQSDSAFDFLLFTIPSRTMEMIAGADGSKLYNSSVSRRSCPLYVRDEVVLQIGRHMLMACDGNGRYAQQFADGLGMALVARLLDHYVDDRTHVNRLSIRPSSLRRVTRYIKDHLAEDIRVADLARIAGLSESHFAHAFRDSMGVPPSRFINSARIEQSQQMLRDSRKSISEIALDCGFRDSSHFARVFRAGTGMSPRCFRFLH
jgi:AraC family transcriptional regulator